MRLVCVSVYSCFLHVVSVVVLFVESVCVCVRIRDICVFVCFALFVVFVFLLFFPLGLFCVLFCAFVRFCKLCVFACSMFCGLFVLRFGLCVVALVLFIVCCVF